MGYKLYPFCIWWSKIREKKQKKWVFSSINGFSWKKFVFLQGLCPNNHWARLLHSGKATLMRCFWPFEPEKLKSKSKTNAEVAYGCVYIRSRSVPRVLVPSCTLFGCFRIYSSVGINSVRSIWKASQGLNGEWAAGDTPFFVCGSNWLLTILTLGYRSVRKHANHGWNTWRISNQG